MKLHVSKASLQHQAGTRYFAEQLCFSLSCSTRCHLWRHCSNGLIACTVEARFMGTQVFLLWTVVPFSLSRFFVVLSVFMYTGLNCSLLCLWSVLAIAKWCNICMFTRKIWFVFQTGGTSYQLKWSRNRIPVIQIKS